MKKLLSLFLALLLILCCFSSFAAVYPDEYPTDKLTASAKLYKKASTKKGTVATLKKGTTVELIGESGNFYRVISGNKTGYVLKKYFKSASDDTEKSSSAKTNPLGSRNNPAKVGDTVTVEVPESKSYKDSGTFEITIESVLRGSAATQKIQQWNMTVTGSASSRFNDSEPAQKVEYLVLYVTVKMVKDTSSTNAGFNVNYTQFYSSCESDGNYCEASYTEYPYNSALLEATLHAGETASGYVPLYIMYTGDSFDSLSCRYTHGRSSWYFNL